MIIFIVLVVKNRHDKHHIIDLEKKHQKEMDNVEATYAKAARQGFILSQFIFALFRSLFLYMGKILFLNDTVKILME